MNHKCCDCSYDSLFVKEVIITYCGENNTSEGIGTEEPTPPVVTPPEVIPTFPEDYISFYVETSEAQEPNSVLNIESYDLIGPWEILEDGVLICNSEGFMASHVRFISPLYENYFSILVDLDSYSDKLYEVYLRAGELIIGHQYRPGSFTPYTINFNKFSSEVNTYYFRLTNLIYMNMNAQLLDNIKDISYMFRESAYFNSDISFWDVSHVENMEGFLMDATAFNQDLSNWCVTQFTSEPTDFSTGATNWTLPKPSWGYCPRGENGVITVPPIINTEWVVNRIADGSSCGKFLVQASRIKDSEEVFSDIEVIPDVQQVSNEIIAGNYGTEVNNAVLAIDPKATDWVLDPANNRVKYTIPAQTGVSVYRTSSVSSTDASTPAASCALYEAILKASGNSHANGGMVVIGDKCVGNAGKGFGFSISERLTDIPEKIEYIPFDTVAAKVISNAEACDTTSKDRLFNIVMPLAYSGFYNDLFEDNIHYGEI